jgi:hypothetical protein
MSQDSSAGTAIGYRLDGRGPIPGKDMKLLSSSQRRYRLWSLGSLLSNEYWGSVSPRGKRPGREADHSPPSSDKVKNDRSIAPLSNTSSLCGS